MKTHHLIPLLAGLAIGAASCDALWDTSLDSSVNFNPVPGVNIGLGTSIPIGGYGWNGYYPGPSSPWWDVPTFNPPYNPGWPSRPNRPPQRPLRPNRPGIMNPGNGTVPSRPIPRTNITGGEPGPVIMPGTTTVGPDLQPTTVPGQRPGANYRGK